ILTGVGRDGDHLGDRRALAQLTPRRRLAAKPDVVLEIEAKGGVALAHTTGLEPARHVIFGDPDLIVAVSEVRRVDQLQLIGEVLADREPRARIGLVRDYGWFDPDL